jgi:hypothetical protein
MLNVEFIMIVVGYRHSASGFLRIKAKYFSHGSDG